MTCRYPCLPRNPRIKSTGRLFALALAFGLTWFNTTARAQNVILHLRNGDRLAGVILSENTNQVTLSTVWAREVVVPVSQIERREIPPPASEGATVHPAGTKHVPGGETILPASAAVKPPADTNTFWNRWSGEVTVGLDLERGATDHELYYTKGKLTYAQAYVADPKQFFRNILSYDYAYGTTDGTTSDNRFYTSAKSDFDLSRRYYLYNLGGVGYDRVRLIDLQYEEGPGFGYHWLTSSNFLVNLEAGADYQVQDRTDDTRTESAYFRLAEDLAWKLRKDMNFTEKFEYYPQVGFATLFRMRFEANLAYALPYHLSLNFTLIDLYDTQPAATVPNNDFQFRTSLGAKF